MGLVNVMSCGSDELWKNYAAVTFKVKRSQLESSGGGAPLALRTSGLLLFHAAPGWDLFVHPSLQHAGHGDL